MTMWTSKAKRAAEYLEYALQELKPLETDKEMFFVLIRDIEAAIPALKSIHQSGKP